jgi:hypothetical protein
MRPAQSRDVGQCTKPPHKVGYALKLAEVMDKIAGQEEWKRTIVRSIWRGWLRVEESDDGRWKKGRWGERM